MTLEEAIGRLKTYEERIKHKSKQVDNQDRLLFTRYQEQGRMRGHGGFNQSRGQENNFKKETHNNPNKLTRDKRVGSENLDGGVTESMSRPGIKEDIYAARTPIGRQSVGSITNQKHDQSGFLIDHKNEFGSNQKNMINLDLRKITAVKVEVTEEKLIYLDVRMITSTTRDQSSSSSNGGFNQKMDQEDLKTYVTAIALDHAREGCECRYHLLKENFELTLRDAKAYTFCMNHIVAARVWSNSFICYLNSVHQEATILELIGDKLMAMSALEWGKGLSLQ
ncbi:hypothetical protein Tco_1461126 [Tanacetum coccineum]